jgi:hypothetical protein
MNEASIPIRMEASSFNKPNRNSSVRSRRKPRSARLVAGRFTRSNGGLPDPAPATFAWPTKTRMTLMRTWWRAPLTTTPLPTLAATWRMSCSPTPPQFHKSQGAEYQGTLLIPLVTQHWRMLQRNLLYKNAMRSWAGLFYVQAVEGRRPCLTALYQKSTAGRVVGAASAEAAGLENVYRNLDFVASPRQTPASNPHVKPRGSAAKGSRRG